MKKFLPMLLAVLLVGVLSGCNKSDKDTTSQTSQSSSDTAFSSSTENNSSSTSEEQTSSTESITEVSSVDDTRKTTPENDVSVLRRELYEAGINSSEMSDSDVEEYAKQAAEKGIDFITYMKETVLK